MTPTIAADAIVHARRHEPIECRDCSAEAETQIFDGAGFVDYCHGCAAHHVSCAPPPWRLGDDWIIGHVTEAWAPHVQQVHGAPAIVVRRPGAHRDQLRERSEIQALINHDPDRCLASTRTDALQLCEDMRGLFFALRVPPTLDGAALQAALRAGRCTGLSIGPAGHRSRLSVIEVRHPDIPPHVHELARQPIRQFSFCLWPLFPCMRGSWAREGSDAAMADLYDVLRAAVAQRSREAGI